MVIKILDSAIADLIAAGEVVERPASVVKELIENSIDAGANSVRIEILCGGRELIRVTDNGCGMDAQDAVTAFDKHATSKISEKSDLFNIHTLGFRGEALPSIAAVSKVTLVTKTSGEIYGTKVITEGGKRVLCEESSSADGTCISVYDLFYNTPARLKFLKTDKSEEGTIADYVEKLAVSRPDISFRLSVNGNETLFTPGNGNLSETVYSVFGREFSEQLLPVDSVTDGIHVYGFVCKPVYSKSNRRSQIFYVNGRTVHSKMLQTVIENSYRNCLMISRYPYCVLFVETDPGDVDINVHPSKLEVKFSDEAAVSLAVSSAVSKALSFDTGVDRIRLSQDNVPKEVPKVPETSVKQEAYPIKKEIAKDYGDWTVYTPEAEKTQNSVFTPGKAASVEDVMGFLENGCVRLNDISVEKPEYAFSKPERQKDPEPEKMMLELEKDATFTSCDFTVIGEAYSAYIIVQKEKELLFVDKHALHERMLFERLKTEKIPTQFLLAPVIVSLGKEDNALLLSNANVLHDAGFDAEDFGGCIAVREIPEILSAGQIEDIFASFASSLAAGCVGVSPIDEILHTVACKAAIKSGSETSERETLDLITRYFASKDKLKYCPHGRPITFSISREDIEKEFKRIV